MHGAWGWRENQRPVGGFEARWYQATACCSRCGSHHTSESLQNSQQVTSSPLQTYLSPGAQEAGNTGDLPTPNTRPGPLSPVEVTGLTTRLKGGERDLPVHGFLLFYMRGFHPGGGTVREFGLRNCPLFCPQIIPGPRGVIPLSSGFSVIALVVVGLPGVVVLTSISIFSDSITSSSAFPGLTRIPWPRCGDTGRATQLTQLPRAAWWEPVFPGAPHPGS